MTLSSRIGRLEGRSFLSQQIDGDYLHDRYMSILGGATEQERAAIDLLARVAHYPEARAELASILGEIEGRLAQRGKR